MKIGDGNSYRETFEIPRVILGIGSFPAAWARSLASCNSCWTWASRAGDFFPSSAPPLDAAAHLTGLKERLRDKIRWLTTRFVSRYGAGEMWMKRTTFGKCIDGRKISRTRKLVVVLNDAIFRCKNWSPILIMVSLRSPWSNCKICGPYRKPLGIVKVTRDIMLV